MFNLPQLSGLLSAGLLLWSGTNLAMLDNGAHQTSPPSLGSDEEPVASVHVAVEPIYAFDKYYINDVNPFVPYNKRVVERKRMWERKRRVRNKPPAKVPEQVKPIEPPKKPVKLPELVLPKFKESKEHVPKVLGSVAMDDRYLLFVKLGDKEAPQMKPGDKIEGWILLDMENDMARFRDPDGEILRVPVGLSGKDANSITDTGTASTGSKNPLQVPSGKIDPQEALRLLKDPKAAQQIMKDPEMREMMKNPMVQDFLRQNGLGHLIDGRKKMGGQRGK